MFIYYAWANIIHGWSSCGYAYISFLIQWWFFCFLVFYVIITDRIESLFSMWLNPLGITTNTAPPAWRHSPWSSPYAPVPRGRCSLHLLLSCHPRLTSQHLGEYPCLSPELDLRSLGHNPGFSGTQLISFQGKHDKGNFCSYLGPNTNIQETDQRRILTSWGHCQQNNLEHGQHSRSHNPVSSANTIQGERAFARK